MIGKALPVFKIGRALTNKNKFPAKLSPTVLN